MRVRSIYIPFFWSNDVLVVTNALLDFAPTSKWSGEYTRKSTSWQEISCSTGTARTGRTSYLLSADSFFHVRRCSRSFGIG